MALEIISLFTYSSKRTSFVFYLSLHAYFSRTQSRKIVKKVKELVKYNAM